ncbi:MAG: hypothetical protein RL136_1900 [Planctomycetota bacterium]
MRRPAPMLLSLAACAAIGPDTAGAFAGVVDVTVETAVDVAVDVAVDGPSDAFFDARGVPARTEDDERTRALIEVFRRLRAAEVERDATVREEIIADAMRAVAAVGADAAISESQFAEERAALARAAAEARARAVSVSEVVSVERAIADRREALVVKLDARAGEVSKPAEGAARELRLETAEDLLFRLLPADATDASLALGVVTAAERAAAEDVLARVGRLLDATALEAITNDAARRATDPLAFRFAFLEGLRRLHAADLGASDADRSHARDSLARAAQSELPRAGELGAILALARARCEVAPGGSPEARAARITEALATSDPGRALVARTLDWTDRGANAPFPALPEGSSAALHAIAGAAELGLLAARGADAGALDAAARRAVESTAGGLAPDRVQAAGRAIAGRIAHLPMMRSPAVQRSRFIAAFALASSAPSDANASPSPTTTTDPASSELRSLARDPVAAPWLAIPLARALVRIERSREACEVLLDLAHCAPDLDATPDACAIALELARAESQRDATGEVLLDRALDTTIRFGGLEPSDRDARALERVDLALFPAHTLANADRAGEALLGVSRRVEILPARELRAAEIEWARANGRTRRPGDAELRAFEHRSAILLEGLDPGNAAVRARALVLRSEVLLALDRPAEAALVAAMATEHAPEHDTAVARALDAWLRATLRDPQPDAAPASVRDRLRARPDLAEQLQPLVEDAFVDAHASILAAMDAEDIRRARSIARQRLAPVVSAFTVSAFTVPAFAAPGTSAADRDRGTTPDALRGPLAHAAIAAAWLGGEEEAARRLAESAATAAPDDRAVQWWLATTLLGRHADDGKDEKSERAPASAEDRRRAFAILKELSPLGAADRDDFWWRAQLAQLEMLADDAGRERDILSRVNRLALIDTALGGKPLARRFAQLRTRCAGGATGAAEPQEGPQP